MPVDPVDKVQVSVPPLRKKDLKEGNVYTRQRKVEEKLQELLNLARKEVLLRCELRDREDVAYIPSECLVHLVRSCRNEVADRHFERLFQILLDRILRRMPSGESRDGKKIALQESLIREKVVDRFQELLAKDRNAYADKLDFYEVRFDMTLKRLLIAVQRQVWRETKRSRPLENPETGEISAEVEESAGTFDPFNSEEFGGNDYRSRLDAAIDSLTPDQRRIVTMCKMGIPIDSIDPKAVTISKTLKRSEKTIRTERKKAFAAIKKFLQKGDE